MFLWTRWLHCRKLSILAGLNAVDVRSTLWIVLDTLPLCENGRNENQILLLRLHFLKFLHQPIFPHDAVGKCSSISSGSIVMAFILLSVRGPILFKSWLGIPRLFYRVMAHR